MRASFIDRRALIFYAFGLVALVLLIPCPADFHYVGEIIAIAYFVLGTFSWFKCGLNPVDAIIVEPAGIEWWRNRAAHDLLDAASDASSVQGTLDLMSRRVLRGNAERADLVLQGPPPRNVEIRTVPLVNGGGLIVLEDVTERFLTDRVRTDFVANISAGFGGCGRHGSPGRTHGDGVTENGPDHR